MPEMRQKLATDRSNQWIAQQFEKSDATMENTRAPLQGSSTAASGSGLTEEEGEVGRSISCNDDTTAIDADVELEEAPGDVPALRNGVMTPENPGRCQETSRV